MVYAEIILERTVDWSSITGGRNVTIPQTAHIPRAGPSQTPREGLGQKKNIKDGVPNEAFKWSPHDSSSSDEGDRDGELEKIPGEAETSRG